PAFPSRALDGSQRVPTPTTAGAAHRLFFALVPAPDARRALSALATTVAAATGGRAPPPENLHLTLAFLGDVPQESVPAVLAIGARGSSVADPFALTFNRVGMFRGAGIAWVAPEVIAPPLAELFQSLQAGLIAHGLRVEDRAFHPHVTLARKCMRKL